MSGWPTGRPNPLLPNTLPENRRLDQPKRLFMESCSVSAVRGRFDRGLAVFGAFATLIDCRTPEIIPFGRRCTMIAIAPAPSRLPRSSCLIVIALDYPPYVTARLHPR